MKILPSSNDLKHWSNIVPTDGDLVFFRSAPDYASELGVPLYSADEVREQSLTLWSLQQRSWYAYALNKSSFAAWMPKGFIEKLDEKTLRSLAEEQIEIEVPTLLLSKNVHASLRMNLLKIGRHWVTSNSYSRLGKHERSKVLQAWMKQNGVFEYEQIQLDRLSESAREEMHKRGFQKLLNGFANQSGPNCFALASASIATAKQAELAKQWLHWAPLEKFLVRQSYRVVSSERAMPGDILVFVKKSQAVHAALYIGDGFYFEKPGQDFYEPYRLVSLAKWKSEWPKTKLVLWRKC